MIMTEATTEKLISLDEVWDNFKNQLQTARQNLKDKEDELEQDAANLTRIDLTEYNNHKIIVSKLEAAIETLDIVRVNVFGEPSKIEIVK
jgi:NADP-dependent 3-hydroxy acid dehydrogenase YdfG